MKRTFNSFLSALTLTLVMITAGVGVSGVGGLFGAEDPDQHQSPFLLPSDETPPISLPRSSQRRDVFYDLVAVETAQVRLAELEQEATGEDRQLTSLSGPSPSLPDQNDGEQTAVQYAQDSVTEVENLMRDEAWEAAMDTAADRLSELRPFMSQFPQNQELLEAYATIQTLYGIAEDKKLYEEARAQFASLGLRVEGIMWSADQASLAIISGEPVARGVNERVRGTVIKNIDQNRVDFLYAYRQRQYHFQLYLEPIE